MSGVSAVGLGIGLVAVVLALVAPQVAGQANVGFERQRTKVMLDSVSREIEKNFYDPTLKGLDWKALKEQTRQRIDASGSLGEMLTAIFSMVDKVQDSHTYFIPPPRPMKIEFGFRAKAFGEEIRVYEVDKGGPAERAGLKPGDLVFSVNNFTAERSTFPLMMRYFLWLRPVNQLQVEVSRNNGPAQMITVQAKITPRSAYVDLTEGVEIWKMIREMETGARESPFAYNTFEDGTIGYLGPPYFTYSERFWQDYVSEIKGAKAVIVDLRDCPGGTVVGLNYFSGFFQSEPGVIGNFVQRKKSEPLRVKPRKPNFTGPMFILVDSQSYSASEIFARHFQRAGRAKVIGDVTGGKVTVSQVFSDKVGADSIVPFAVAVAVGRLLFEDGEELEKRGVTPDVMCIPTEQELARGFDRCRALAMSMAREALGRSGSDEDKP